MNFLFILVSLFFLFDYSHSNEIKKLDPKFFSHVPKNRLSSLNMETYLPIKAGVYKKDGTVDVVDLTKTPIESLIKDKSVVYIEYPKKMVPISNVAYSSSFAVNGSSDLTINKPFKFYLLSGSLSSLPSNCVNDYQNHYICSSGKSLSFSSPFSGIIYSDSTLIPSDIKGYSSIYTLGASATSSNLTGNGVIVGIVDTGINFCHPSFLDSKGKTRILYYKRYDGYELNSEQINQKISQKDCNYFSSDHGTLVSSIAAGYTPSVEYNSPAKDAKFIVYQTDLSSTDVALGIKYIYDKSKSLKLPSVVNLSLGTQSDPHDGTGFLDKYIDQLSSSGFIVVAAAGNEGSIPIHASEKSISSVQFEISVNGNVELSGWYTNPVNPKIVLSDNSGNSVTSNFPSIVNDQPLGGCTVSVYNSSDVPLWSSNKLAFYVDIYCSSETKLKINVSTSSATDIDMFLSRLDGFSVGYFLNGYHQDITGGYKYTISSPATSKSVIAVGSIRSNYITTNPGLISGFSSRGPTVDGRIKPDIVAAGDYVCGANAFDTTNITKSCSGAFTFNRGTSFAAPVVAGLIAMYLQANPTADFNAVKSFLVNNAVKDVPLPFPNEIYGYGKVNGSSLQSDSNSNNSNITTSSGSGGGCNTIGNSNTVIIFISLTIILAIRKIRRISI